MPWNNGTTFMCCVSKLPVLNVQVGYDQHSFGYRDMEGVKVGKKLITD